MKLKSFALAAAAALLITSTLFAAQNGPRSESFPTFPGVTQGAIPDAGAGIYFSSVTVGYETSGAPCYNCGVSGTVAIPYPLAWAQAGSSIDVITQLQDVNYTGTPTIAISIKQGGTQIYSGYTTFTSPLGPGYVALAYFPLTLPTTKGETTVAAEIVSGGTTIGTSKFRFVVY